MNLVFSPLARDDLRNLGVYIAQQSLSRAFSFTNELVTACEALTEWPLSSPLIPVDGNVELRRRVYKCHLIIYRVTEEAVEIVRIFHGSRDYERVLFPKG